MSSKSSQQDTIKKLLEEIKILNSNLEEIEAAIRKDKPPKPPKGDKK